MNFIVLLFGLICITLILRILSYISPFLLSILFIVGMFYFITMCYKRPKTARAHGYGREYNSFSSSENNRHNYAKATKSVKKDVIDVEFTQRDVE